VLNEKRERKNDNDEYLDFFRLHTHSSLTIYEQKASVRVLITVTITVTATGRTRTSDNIQTIVQGSTTNSLEK
jgi:hypothetical protein